MDTLPLALLTGCTSALAGAALMFIFIPGFRWYLIDLAFFLVATLPSAIFIAAFKKGDPFARFLPTTGYPHLDRLLDILLIAGVFGLPLLAAGWIRKKAGIDKKVAQDFHHKGALGAEKRLTELGYLTHTLLLAIFFLLGAGLALFARWLFAT